MTNLNKEIFSKRHINPLFEEMTLRRKDYIHGATELVSEAVKVQNWRVHRDVDAQEEGHPPIYTTYYDPAARAAQTAQMQALAAEQIFHSPQEPAAAAETMPMPPAGDFSNDGRDIAHDNQAFLEGARQLVEASSPTGVANYVPEHGRIDPSLADRPFGQFDPRLSDIGYSPLDSKNPNDFTLAA